jgi:hypothetical protein
MKCGPPPLQRRLERVIINYTHDESRESLESKDNIPLWFA